jgi:hypothetical protein
MSMTIRRPLDFNDAGAGDDEPVKGVLQGHIREWHDEIDRLTRQLAETREALQRYGDHTYECDMKNTWNCTCGYSAALSASAPQIAYDEGGGAVAATHPAAYRTDDGSPKPDMQTTDKP